MSLLLLIVRCHCLPNEDLRRSFKAIHCLSDKAAAVLLLLLLQLANSGSSSSDIIVEGCPFELNLLAEGDDQLFKELDVLGVDGQVRPLFFQPLRKGVTNLPSNNATSFSFSTRSNSWKISGVLVEILTVGYSMIMTSRLLVTRANPDS